MKIEIEKASLFLARLISAPRLSDTIRQSFAQAVAGHLIDRIRRSWDPNDPIRGSAYRCISSHRGFIDPLLRLAATEINLQWSAVAIPSDFSVWIDPGCVSFRLGEFGSISDIYREADEVHAIHTNSGVGVSGDINTNLNYGQIASAKSPAKMSIPTRRGWAPLTVSV
jgi:protein Tob/BTG